jgi:hypothetical protein
MYLPTSAAFHRYLPLPCRVRKWGQVVRDTVHFDDKDDVKSEPDLERRVRLWLDWHLPRRSYTNSNGRDLNAYIDTRSALVQVIAARNRLRCSADSAAELYARHLIIHSHSSQTFKLPVERQSSFLHEERLIKYRGCKNGHAHTPTPRWQKMDISFGTVIVLIEKSAGVDVGAFGRKTLPPK